MRSNGALGAVGLLLLAGCVTPAAVQTPPAMPVQTERVEQVADETLPGAEDERAPAIYRVSGEADQAVHARVHTAHAGMSGAADLNLPQARPTNGTLTVTWQSRQPLGAAIEVWFAEAGGRDIVQAYGVSPIVLPIAGEAFGHGMQFVGWVEPGGPAGAMIEDSVVFDLSVTYPAGEE